MSKPKDQLHLGLGEITERHPLPWSHHVLVIKDANGREVIHLGGVRGPLGPNDPDLLAGLAALLVGRVNEFVPSNFAREHQIDVDFETARALHRVVRAMHDGECPKCHAIVPSDRMRGKVERDGTGELICPRCGYSIDAETQRAAIAAFAPVMEKNRAVFEQWAEEHFRAAIEATHWSPLSSQPAVCGSRVGSITHLITATTCEKCVGLWKKLARTESV